jgi:hypothetical protein
MIPNIYRYPLDLTGTSRSNYVTGENQSIGTSTVRAIAPNAGAFFGKSIQILDRASNLTLNDTQYSFQFLHEELTIKSGLEVWGILLITDPSVSANISLSYQAVGGPIAGNYSTMAAEIATLQLDSRAVAFRNITGFPDTVKPVPHMHWVGDTYDWDYIVNALELCLNAMTLSEAASYDTVLTYIDQQKGLYTTQIAGLAAQLAAHIANYNNPHQTTLLQVDAYSSSQVDSLIATETTNRIAADAVVNNAIQAHATCYHNPHVDTADDIGGYSTSETDANLNAVKAALNAQMTSDANAMAAHIGNTNNPHKVTLDQLNGYTTQQINTAISNGVSPVATQLANDTTQMNAHIANTNNPHQTTIAQIGAWDNASINTLNTNVANHIVNTSNPHGVTAAQASTWTSAQISAQIANAYTTPVTTALNSQANVINGHIGNRSNPHNVTVAQIGGWTYAQWLATGQAQQNANSYH